MVAHESHAAHWTHGVDRASVRRVVDWLRQADAELQDAVEPIGAGGLVDLLLAAQAIERRFLADDAQRRALASNVTPGNSKPDGVS